MIKGFGFSGYRSVGKDLIKIGPLKKINLIIGQNNTGKSNIIRFLNEHYNNVINSLGPLPNISGANLRFKDIDTNQSGGSRPKFALCINISSLKIFKNPKIDKIIRSNFCVDIKDKDCAWFEYECDALNNPYYPLFDVDKLVPILEKHEWQDLWSSLTGKGSGGLREHWIPQTMQHIFEKIRLNPQKIELIPDIRRIGDPETQADDFSGLGIIDRLAQLQNLSLESQKDKQRFEKINLFLRTVLENEEATLEIPYSRDVILVHMDRKTLPLSSLGTGIHEVIILAAAATLLEDAVLCIEEPVTFPPLHEK